MKVVIGSILLALTLVGCATMERLGQVRSEAEKLIRPGLQQAAMARDTAPAGSLTRQEARDIALVHAGLTLGQVSRLRVEYDPEEGQPRYEVEFHQGRWEYTYEIDARTGKILSHGKER